MGHSQQLHRCRAYDVSVEIGHGEQIPPLLLKSVDNVKCLDPKSHPLPHLPMVREGM
jgi:hypothetical protein